MTRTCLPKILCLCVSLMLALFGVQTAGACPGEAVVAVVACGHDGVIWLDASGQPAKPCAHCPDCIATPLTLSTPPAPGWHPRGAEPLRHAVAHLSLPAPQPLASARAPPALA